VPNAAARHDLITWWDCYWSGIYQNDGWCL